MKSPKEQMKDIPVGSHFIADRYDTDNEYIIELWTDIGATEPFSIKIIKCKYCNIEKLYGEDDPTTVKWINGMTKIKRFSTDPNQLHPMCNRCKKVLCEKFQRTIMGRHESCSTESIQ